MLFHCAVLEKKKNDNTTISKTVVACGVSADEVFAKKDSLLDVAEFKLRLKNESYSEKYICPKCRETIQKGVVWNENKRYRSVTAGY